MVTAFVGSGGKTSLIKRRAKEYTAAGKRVLIVTSTHMLKEPDTIVGADAEVIVKALSEKGYAMAGTDAGNGKIGALPEDVYFEVCRHADEVLVEADGSRGLPLKYPAENEPVIYGNTDETVVVTGLSAIGKRAADVCHRAELIPKSFGISADTVIDAEQIKLLAEEGYVKPLLKKFPKMRVSVYAAQCDDMYKRAVGALIENGGDVTAIKKEWFAPKPVLVICGGGHISRKLAAMASELDFYIRVIDPREEFADKKSFPGADEVICAAFDRLDAYMETGAYYVIVTRGHADDRLCAEKILSEGNYSYIGMIGSKRKVGITFDLMRENGFCDERLSDIHAPIGLKIGAVTPAEIAVSILAEIIEIKNKKSASSVSAELLSSRAAGTLCVITEKTGSSPRGAGSMMLVTDDTVIDTIGGGKIEYSAICEARRGGGIRSVRYELSAEKSAELGMICGGSNTVLFIPLREALPCPV